MLDSHTQQQSDFLQRAAMDAERQKLAPEIQLMVNRLLKQLLTECVSEQWRGQTMNKITPDHLARNAFVYIRQSTSDQLLNNPESRRRQYALDGRAEALGWKNASSLMTISAAPVAALPERDLSACSWRSVPAAPGRCWPSKPHVSLVMAGNCTRYSSSAVWLVVF